MNNAMKRRFNTQAITVTEPSALKIKKDKDAQKTFLGIYMHKKFLQTTVF